MSNRVAVFTVFHPAVAPFLEQFKKSLLEQTCKDFDLLVVNDGLGEKYLSGLEGVILPSGGAIAKNREIGLNYLVDNGYEMVVFADADDFFSANRVEVACRLLKEYDLVINDLTLVNVSGNDLKKDVLLSRLPKFFTFGFEAIVDFNFCGMSNAAMRLSPELGKIDIPETLSVIDWYFFTKYLLRGKTGIFTDEAATYYRQHGDNMVGYGKINVLQSLRVKKAHYSELRGESQLFESKYKTVCSLLQVAEKMDEKEIDKVMSGQEMAGLFWWEDSCVFERHYRES